eukprot:3662555-Prymnesium_polylepis.1
MARAAKAMTRSAVARAHRLSDAPLAASAFTVFTGWFHVNYGQTLTLWDRLGGTFYSREKDGKYGEKNFSW